MEIDKNHHRIEIRALKSMKFFHFVYSKPASRRDPLKKLKTIFRKWHQKTKKIIFHSLCVGEKFFCRSVWGEHGKEEKQNAICNNFRLMLLFSSSSLVRLWPHNPTMRVGCKNSTDMMYVCVGFIKNDVKLNYEWLP